MLRDNFLAAQCSPLLSALHCFLSRLLLNLQLYEMSLNFLCHYGYETNKRHLNQASFAAPTKFANIFVSERNYLLCALKCHAITRAVRMEVS